MLKRSISILMVLLMLVGLAACGQEPVSEEPVSASDENWKIGIMTGTVSQNEEEYRAAQEVVKKYGEEHVILMTYPDKFMDEQETTIANVESMASDPAVKAIIIVQAVPGTSAAIDKAKEIRDDILFICGVPGEDPKMIASKADVVFAMDELSMGSTLPEQAKKQGATKFVHYSFPRHMSYALLSARRDLLKENCEKLGLEFIDATAPDPTGDAGVSGAQQFILEDVPRKVEQYGKDTAFFSTNCSMQVPLIKACLDEGAIYPQPCCPSPYHGFPSALGIEIPEDKKGDIDFVVSQIKEKIAEKGGTGRFSTWRVPCAMMFVEAGAEYAKAYIDGETNGKLDVEKINEKFKEYAKTDVHLTPLKEGGKTYDNYLMVLMDFLNF
ncbi:DUF3798 domain-containing protein [Crassaminicella indica]|uniref:DUF3798 domain-containing protein n=1 Tax=Crassaminicella indica TaxID=2855394 RepID=A0ABX8RBC9_9CLOT|nr:DUF3798 domain-containing protein [Crassaminicella indica]QXM06359.1 DUF3798 domain-containing protein [Crassaminicella indica]